MKTFLFAILMLCFAIHQCMLININESKLCFRRTFYTKWGNHKCEDYPVCVEDCKVFVKCIFREVFSAENKETKEVDCAKLKKAIVTDSVPKKKDFMGKAADKCMKKDDTCTVSFYECLIDEMLNGECDHDASGMKIECDDVC